MRYLKTILFFNVFVSVLILTSTSFAQRPNYLNEQFEGFGWWDTGNWTRGIGTDPSWAPDNALGGGRFEFGPNRNRWKTGEWSAYATRRSSLHTTAPSNYESTYVAGVHTWMDKRGISLAATTNPVVLTFDYYMNAIRQFPLINSDSFYVAVKVLGSPAWVKIYGGTGDSSRWASASVTLGTYINTTVNQIIDLRFGFVGRNTPPTLVGGTAGIDADRAYGVYFDNVMLKEIVTLDVFAGAIQLRNGVSGAFITDPVKCENFIPWVYAGAKNPPNNTYPYSYKYDFFVGLTKVVDGGTRTQASAADTSWNALTGTNTGTTTQALTYPTTNFRLVVYPPTGTLEVDATNNTVLNSFAVSDFTLGNMIPLNTQYFPRLPANTMFLEKGFDSPSKFAITKLNGFNKNVNMSYTITGVPTNSVIASTGFSGGFSPNPTTADTAFMSVYVKDTDPKLLEGIYNMSATASYTSRSGGTCAQTKTFSGLVPDDFMLVPNPDTLYLEANTSAFTNNVEVWRFNKHNKPVNLKAFSDRVGNFTYTPNDNPVGTGRPNKSMSVLAVTHTAALPVTLPLGGAFRYLLEGRDGTKLADTVLFVHVRQVPNFTLAVTPATRTIWKTESTSYTVNITRTNFTAAVNFSPANISVSPAIAGATFSFSSASTTGNSVTLNVVTTGATAPGTYTITVTGKGGTPELTRTATCQLQVNPNWDYTMNVREWNTFSNNTNVKFGMNSSATNGFDPALGELLYAMPADPIVFGSAFVIDTTFGVPRFSQTDIRPHGDSFRWKMHVQGRFPFRLMWYPALLPKTYNFRLKDAITNGAIFNYNMKTKTTTDPLVADSTFLYDWAISGVWSVYLEMTPGFTKTTGVDNNDIADVLPSEFSIEQNFPNPFNPSTVIVYNLPKNDYVKVDVYNALGQHIKTLVNEVQNAGRRAVVWNASNNASGVYFYKIQAGNSIETRKMILMK
ncbi:MAG: T9SS type A sorting domain-containing protein [Ignavibacteria bacterium]|nr:T9SS type A sorting domain-containing protein [Ignavibacteria bacterium]